MSSVSSLTLVGLYQEMNVALGLPLKVANITLGCILSILLSDFKALGPISIPTPPTKALTEFFHADTVASVLISSSCHAASTDILDPFSPLLSYQSSLLAGLQGYIPYPNIAAVRMFELVVLLLLGHMRGSLGVNH